MNWLELVGKKIEALRGHKINKYGKEVTTLNFILFDDKETYLELSEQDKYDYHDCCDSARMLDLYKDKKGWQQLLDQVDCVEFQGKVDPF